MENNKYRKKGEVFMFYNRSAPYCIGYESQKMSSDCQ